jgi:hypothetical protein
MIYAILAIGSIANYAILGCKQDNMSYTHLLMGLFLGEYFLNIFLNPQNNYIYI